jgi:hypothetical protein
VRTRHDRYLFRLWLARWGFAVTVAAAIVIGLAFAVTVVPPTDIPTFALRAAPVYRAEVGATVFLGLYIASMALALALQNRAFTKIGTAGVRAQDLATASGRVASDDALMEVLMDLSKEVNDLQVWREEGQVVN